MSSVNGACLCGAVQIRASRLPAEISACHCEMCRRWSGGVQMGLEVAEADLSMEGPVARFRSSFMSERLWCATCGSSIGFRNLEGDDAGTIELVPGLFDNAGGAVLTRVVYADCAPEGYDIAGPDTGTVERVSKTQYEARFAHVEDGR